LVRACWWTLPIVVAAAYLALGGRDLGWAGRLAWFAAMGLALELSWRGGTGRSTPVYRRHLAVCGLLALFALGGGFGRWLASLAGTGIGLSLAGLPWLWSRRLKGMSWVRGSDRRPDADAPLVLVADPHWSGALTGLEPARVAWPEADWLFLGDIFDVWVGLPGMETPLEREFLDWVAARRREGRWVGFWLGNREYFLDTLADRFDLMGEGIGGELPLERLRWEHGDLVNRADWRYRLWNLASRSGPVWLIARLLPRPAARALAQRLQRAMGGTNQACKLSFPREAFRAATGEVPGATFITGHFHQLEREGGGTALPWAHEGRFMLWQGGQVKPLDRQEGPIPAGTLGKEAP
jgi:UDP-2,3-diacylglucosamine pyrophosphatase LpxH